MNFRLLENIRCSLALALLCVCLSPSHADYRNNPGKRQQYALIINSDTLDSSKESHANNVNRSIQLLSQIGYSSIYLAVPPAYVPPAVRVAMVRDRATRDGVDRLIDRLAQQISPNDELLIYMTGHGSESINSRNRQEAGIVLLNHEVYAFSDLAERLHSVRFDHRTVMIDTCMAGGGISHFVDADQKTTGITLGAVGENVSCQRLSPYFWEPDESKIVDQNHDGKIDLNERFAYMMSQATVQSGLRSHPQIVPARQNYTLAGEVVSAPFVAMAKEVDQSDQLDGMLAQLRPGQIAVVEYSTDWCGVCGGSIRNGVRVKGYDAQFDELARQAGGQFLFVRLKGRNGGEARWPVRHQVRAYPTVRLFNHLGQQVDVQQRDAPLADVAAVALYRPETIVAASVKRLRELGHGKNDEYHRIHALSTLTHLGKIEHVTSTPDLNRLLLDIVVSSVHTGAERLHAVDAFCALNPRENAFVTQMPLIKQLLSEAHAQKDDEQDIAARLLLGLLPLELLKNLDDQVYQNMLALWTEFLNETTGSTHLAAAQGRTILMYHKMLHVKDEIRQLLEDDETQVGAIMFLGWLFRKEAVPDLLELAINFSQNKALSETNRRAIQYRVNTALIVFSAQYYELSEHPENQRLSSLIDRHLAEMERQLAKSNAADKAADQTAEDAESESDAIANAERAVLSFRAVEREHGVPEPLFRLVNFKQEWGLLSDRIPKNAKHKSERRWLWGPVVTIGAYEMESRYHPRGTLGIRLASSTGSGVPRLFARYGFTSELGVQTERGPLVLPSQPDPVREDKTWAGGYLSLGGYVALASALLVKGHPVIAHWMLLSASAKVTGLGSAAAVPLDGLHEERRTIGLWSLSGVLNLGPLHVSTVIREKPVIWGISYVVDLPISETRTGVDVPAIQPASAQPIPERRVGHAIQWAASIGF